MSYEEGLLVGYRWHDTRRIPARYPFGHGLSYTTFRYSDLATDKKEYAPTDTVTVTITLENKGKVAGAETVQFYAAQKAPRLPRPAKELKGFSKTTLAPGEKKTVTVTIPVADLAYYDDTLRQWVVDDDDFTILAGASSTDIRGKAVFKTRSSNSLADNKRLP